MKERILGIDPGTKYMGAAVIAGSSLLGFGVHTLQNGERPHDVIGQARQVILSYIAEHAPSVVAIEKPLLVPTKRAALVSVIAQELQARSRELGIRVIEMSPPDVRRIVVGDAHANKYDVAHAIVKSGFEDLRVKLPTAPPHPVLGYKPKDKYWLHMFDAVAVALATRPSPGAHDQSPPVGSA
jgi:Holliday junction resolvasome RuvABC endonuclease subunit